MKETLAFQITALYRDFLAYTTKELKDLGLSFGLMPLVVYVGKHPNCTQADLTKDLKLDWGYSQRSIQKLVENGFMLKNYDQEISGNLLTLTEHGQHTFAVCHSVFFSWDMQKAEVLSPEEEEELFSLLQKIRIGKKANPS